MISVSREVRERFPGLTVMLAVIEGVEVKGSSRELEELKRAVEGEVRAKYRAEGLKDLPAFRCYRDFMWRVGVDPTKARPAAEALIRRTLIGKPVPTVNTVVDAYNLASMATGVALAAFDLDKLRPPITLRFAREGEEFLGIGMRSPKRLEGVEVVACDQEKLIAIYPYRDAEDSKVTLDTRNVALMTCGVPGIPIELLERAEQLAIDYVTRFCGGSVKGRWRAP